MSKSSYSIGAAVFLVLTAWAPARADSYNISFNSLSESDSATQTDTAAANVIDAALGTTGATVSGAIVDGGYTADGNVTGPRTGTHPGNYSVNPYTLADMDGGTFLVNDSAAFGGNSNSITLTFKTAGNMNITGISFDYEIFPDINCTALTPSSDCGGSGDPNQPGISLYSGSSELWSSLAPAPPSSPSGTDYTYSPNSLTTPETAPQSIGTESLMGLNISSTGGVFTLTFNDWPPAIGINNIVIDTATQTGGVSTPEPTAVVLLGTLFAILIAPGLRKKLTARA